MRLHFYDQLLYGGRLTDLAGLPREEQEQIRQHNHYLERCLGALRCRLHPRTTSRVLPEWKKGKITFSLFTCCTVHAFDVQTTMRRLSLEGDCLAGTRAGCPEDPVPPPRPSFAWLPALRSLLNSVPLVRRRGLTGSPCSNPLSRPGNGPWREVP
jgi:hypothetical protein